MQALKRIASRKTWQCSCVLASDKARWITGAISLWTVDSKL